MKNILAIGALAVALLFAGNMWSRSLSSNDSTIIATSGIHWHPRLTITVKEEEVSIPTDIGVGSAYANRPSYGDGGMAMTAIHTHDDVPIIHLEFSGLVRKEDITLARFFEVWGRDMRSFGEKMRMTVNGTENTELGNYLMQDGDRIELRYE